MIDFIKDLKNFVPKHNAQVIPKEKVVEALPWVHIAVSNAKGQILNTFHDVKPEFCRSISMNFVTNSIGDILVKEFLTDWLLPTLLYYE